MSPGGEGGDTFANNPRKEEIREHLRKINTGKTISEETTRKRVKTVKENGTFAGPNNPMYGKVFSEEHKRKIGEKSKGNKPPHTGKSYDEFFGVERSREIREKIGRGCKGRVNSPEHRQKISIANKGKIVSEETREKISAANRGKIPPNVKLTPEIVKEIRYTVLPSKPSDISWKVFTNEIGLKYGISGSVIRKILYRASWKSI